MARHAFAQHITAQHSTAQCSSGWDGMAWHSAAQDDKKQQRVADGASWDTGCCRSDCYCMRDSQDADGVRKLSHAERMKRSFAIQSLWCCASSPD